MAMMPLMWTSKTITEGLTVTTTSKRSPDRCPTHPGAFIREVVLPAMSTSKSEVARALGISRQALYDVLSEKQPVTPMMAVRLSIVFETSAASWLNMQSAFDLWHAERTLDRAKMQPLKVAV